MDEAVGSPVRAGWWRRREVWVGVMLLILAGLVLWDRWELCQSFLFKYFDQDQALLWYAAREFLHGRFHEPCFYGQDYNTCIESYLAAPLLICGLPYWVALPVVTVVLGLLPFYLMAWMAWRRGQELVAGLCAGAADFAGDVFDDRGCRGVCTGTGDGDCAGGVDIGEGEEGKGNGIKDA